VNVGGWFLSDDFNTPKKFRIPNGTMISARGFVVFTKRISTQAARRSPSVRMATKCGSSPRIRTRISPATRTASTSGGGGKWSEFRTPRHQHRRRTFRGSKPQRPLNATNSGPRVGPVVITEIMFHPPDFGTNDNSATSSSNCRTSVATQSALRSSQSNQRMEADRVARLHFPGEQIARRRRIRIAREF
jgi:hypothetical protein